MLILAFDTATDVATSALLDDGEVLGERSSIARTLLEDVDALLRQGRPGRPTSTRSSSERGPGASPARGSAWPSPAGSPSRSESRAPVSRRSPRSRQVRTARFPSSTRAGERCSYPVAAPSRRSTSRRRERLCVGDGAVRYRQVLEDGGASVPPDDDPRHVPRAVLHARLATTFGPVEEIEPIYARAPDAERWRR